MSETDGLEGEGYVLFAYYHWTLAISVLLLLVYLFIWHKHFDVHITLLFTLVPIANLGYALVCHAQSLEAALVATKFAYIAGCYLLLLLFLAVLGLCDIEIDRRLRIALFAFSTVVYGMVLTIGESRLYYEDVTLVTRDDGASMLSKVYGPLHSVFIAMSVAYFIATLAVVVYCYVKKNQVSRKNLSLLFLTEAVGMVCFFGGRRVLPGVELLCFAYDFALATYLVIAYRLSLYDVAGSAIYSLMETGVTGFVSFDFDYCYLGSNEVAKDFIPALRDLTVDRSVESDEFMAAVVVPHLKEFSEDESKNEFNFERGGKTYRIGIRYLFSGRRKRGY